MIIKLFRSFIVTVTIMSAGLLLIECDNNETPIDAKPLPVITAVTPDHALAGGTVNITGENFSTVPENNIVKINGTTAVVTSCDVNKIVTTVPAGAVTGKITVTIDGVVATSATDLTVLQGPVITAFDPTIGIAGMSVTITGANFLNITEHSLKFNGIQATVTNITDTHLVVNVPEGATTGKITADVLGTLVTSSTNFTVPQPPTLTSFTPAHALPGELITITGTNFISGNMSLNIVKVNGIVATVNSATDVQLTATLPADATTGSISVEVFGRTASTETDFEVLKDLPRNQLLAFYPFTGNAGDVSGHGLNGTPTNGAALTTDRFGTPGQAYSLDGIDDYIDMGNPAALRISDEITISCWVKFPTVSLFSPILTKMGYSPGTNPTLLKGYSIKQFFYNSSGYSAQYGCYSESAAGQYHALENGAAPLDKVDTWYHLVMVVKNKDLEFYENGTHTVHAGSPFEENMIADGSLGNLLVGKISYPESYFKGVVDDVAIYNRALTPAEVTQLYQQTVSKY